MKRHVQKFAVIGCLAFAAVPSLAFGQTGNECSPPALTTFRSLSQAETDILVADLAEFNPVALDVLLNDPEAIKEQIESLRELLAFASQAVKEGLASERVNCAELANIRDEVIVSKFLVRQAQGEEETLFGSIITDERVLAFWNGKNSQESADRKAFFDRFLSTKLTLRSREMGENKELAITQDERDAIMGAFARTQITVREFEARKAQIADRVKASVETSIKLQQAQFLARQYSETISEKILATEDEINSFIAARPELNRDELKTKATEILERAKKGEDFAALADRYSQDPGNRNEDGKLNGGLYRDVPRGTFLPAFEQASLSLKPGEIFPALVGTDFGFHVIKLERKDTSADGTFDVRHILIDTTVADPDAPEGRGLPVREYARQQIETEKERKLLASLIQAHQITVAEDFALPAATAKPQPR